MKLSRINTGVVSNDGTGTPLRSGGDIVNELAEALESTGINPDQPSAYDYSVSDRGGRVAFGLRDGGMELLGAALKSDTSSILSFLGPDGSALLGLLRSNGLAVPGAKLVASPADYTFSIADRGGRIAFAVRNDGSIVGAGSGDANASIAPSPMADITHLLIYGQSLAVGALGTPPLTTSTSAALMPDTGTRTHDADPSSFVALAESSVETACAGAAHAFVEAVTASEGMFSRQVLASTAGVAGYALASLNKGTEPYADLLAKAQWAHDYAALQGWDYIVPGIGWMHAEADAANGTGMAYGSLLSALQYNIQTDLQSITGQTSAIPMFTYQLSSFPRYLGTVANPSNLIPLAVLSACQKGPLVQCVGPMYMLPYADGLHLTNHGYRRYGCYLGKAVRSWMTTGQRWRPLEPIRASKINARTVVVNFNVPKPPLRWDTTNITQLADGFNGFELWDSSGRVAIASVAITGPTTVSVTAAADLASNPQVAYAMTADIRGSDDGTGHFPDYNSGPVSGVRGRLCDSETATSDLTDGSGTPYSLTNYCVHFLTNLES